MPYSGPNRSYNAVQPFSPVDAAYEEERRQRSLMRGGTESVGFAPQTPDMSMAADAGYASQSYQQSRLQDAYQQERALQSQTAMDAQPFVNPRPAPTAEDLRVQRLTAVGYSPKEAVRQVYGGPRTVAEEKELIGAQGQEGLEKAKFLQASINQRAAERDAARERLALDLERSKHGDREASLRLKSNQAYLKESDAMHRESQRALEVHMTGSPVTSSSTPGIDELNAQVDQEHERLASLERGRQGAIENIRTMGQPGTGDSRPGSSPDEVRAEQVRYYAHPEAWRKQNPGKTAPPGTLPLSSVQRGRAKEDPKFKAWLENRGYDVSGLP